MKARPFAYVIISPQSDDTEATSTNNPLPKGDRDPAVRWPLWSCPSMPQWPSHFFKVTHGLKSVSAEKPGSFLSSTSWLGSNSVRWQPYPQRPCTPLRLRAKLARSPKVRPAWSVAARPWASVQPQARSAAAPPSGQASARRGRRRGQGAPLRWPRWGAHPRPHARARVPGNQAPRSPASPTSWPLKHQPGLYSSRAARPGPSSPHPLSATSERGRGAPPAPARRPLPARLLRITCLGVLRSGPGRCRSVARPLAPSSRLPSSPPPPPWVGVGVSHAAPGESGRRLPGAPNTDKPRGREREREEGRRAKLRGWGVEIKGSGEGNGGKEGQMGRGRKEREMRKAEGGRLWKKWIRCIRRHCKEVWKDPGGSWLKEPQIGSSNTCAEKWWVLKKQETGLCVPQPQDRDKGPGWRGRWTSNALARHQAEMHSYFVTTF